MDDIRVYVNILSDSLRKKLDVLQELFSLTKKQKKLILTDLTVLSRKKTNLSKRCRNLIMDLIPSIKR